MTILQILALGAIAHREHLMPFLSISISRFQSNRNAFRAAEARRTTILQPVEQKPHSQKDREDEKAEGYVPDERTR